MIILDTLIVGGLAFVLRRIADAVDAELNDDAAVREELLAAQMRRELGEITEEEFVALERVLLARLREILERRRADAAASGPVRIAGIEATVVDEAAGPDAR